MEGYLSISEVAERWNLSPRRVQKMCADGKIPGVTKFGRSWVIPEGAEKPIDKRLKSGKYVGWRNNIKDI